ncbi:MAG: LacI family DNA-binding transcriptional regulator [Thermomicrobiales bacterium]|nr:LacI family DNA-binding transcriptional regulator [Thermomicrobiales bacterium]
MNRRATLKDVAAAAGVSTATVARVLHGNGYVAEATRRRVETAVDRTGYHINAVAQGLRRQRTSTLGLLVPGIIPNPFFASVAHGVEQEAVRHGCGVLTVNTFGDPERERIGVETLLRRRVDALLFTAPRHEDNVRLARAADIPVVQIERKTAIDTLAVTVDNWIGAFTATRHLLDLGHRRIAYIGVDPDRVRHRPGAATHPNVEQDRLSGFQDAMTRAGVPIDNDLVALGSCYYDQATGMSNSIGHDWMRTFLGLPDPPTAVFATSDIFAAGVLQAAYERGLRVPDDVSIVGFDDTYAKFFAPPLTTVGQPMVEIGEAAARLALRDLGSLVGSAERSLGFVTRLIVRASTGPPSHARYLASANNRNLNTVIDDSITSRSDAV